ncbi:MAG TPA: phosphotransferase [Thermomicrobiales bacterium]|nr:phosphotransferase [Thermomicrobiales bacterium]
MPGVADGAEWPGDEALAAFGVRAVAPLGGRLNRHWLVARGDERLVLRRWATPPDDVAYELRLLVRVAALGWPVAPAVAGPLEMDGRVWGLFPFLPGEPPSLPHGPPAEQRARGRLLAEFHADLARLDGFGQRGEWRRCEAILADPALDRLLAAHERERPEEVRLLRWHLELARARIATLRPADRPDQLIHGDFTAWNLRYRGGRLSGILDFELAHRDHRIADFALSWRGKYDAVIQGYAEVAPLEPEEWALLTPMWWAWLIELARRDLAARMRHDGWTVAHLLRRSPLMGPDAVEYR